LKKATPVFIVTWRYVVILQRSGLQLAAMFPQRLICVKQFSYILPIKIS